MSYYETIDNVVYRNRLDYYPKLQPCSWLKGKDPMPFKDEKDKEVPKRVFLIDSLKVHMSRRNWRKAGKPIWWVRIGYGTSFRMIAIPKVKGYKPLKIEIDLDYHAIPPYETIYFGVGPCDIGVRDEYPMSIDIIPSRLIWFLRPRIDDHVLTNDCLWMTRDGRYRILRQIKKPVYAQYELQKENTDGFYASAIHGRYFGRFNTLEEALIACYINAEAPTECNMDAVLMESSMIGVDFLPEVIVEKPKRIKTEDRVCPKCRSKEMWSEIQRFCLNCMETFPNWRQKKKIVPKMKRRKK